MHRFSRHALDESHETDRSTTILVRHIGLVYEFAEICGVVVPRRQHPKPEVGIAWLDSTDKDRTFAGLDHSPLSPISFNFTCHVISEREEM
jgi:hypothetical protein